MFRLCTNAVIVHQSEVSNGFSAELKSLWMLHYVIMKSFEMQEKNRHIHFIFYAQVSSKKMEWNGKKTGVMYKLRWQLNIMEIYKHSSRAVYSITKDSGGDRRKHHHILSAESAEMNRISWEDNTRVCGLAFLGLLFCL